MIGGDLPGDRPAVPGQAERDREGGAVHRSATSTRPGRRTGSASVQAAATYTANDRRDPTTSAGQGRHGRPSPNVAAARPEHRCRRRSSSSSRSAATTTSRTTLDIDRYTIDGKDRSDSVVAVRELDSDGLHRQQTNWINQHTRLHPRQRLRRRRRQHRRPAHGKPASRSADLPSSRRHSASQPRIYFGEHDHRTTRSSATKQPASSTSPAPAATQQTRPRTPAAAASRSAACFNRLALRGRSSASEHPAAPARSTADSKILYDRDPRGPGRRRSRRGSRSTATRTRRWSTAGSCGSSTATPPRTATRTRSARPLGDVTDGLADRRSAAERGPPRTSTTSATR